MLLQRQNLVHLDKIHYFASRSICFSLHFVAILLSWHATSACIMQPMISPSSASTSMYMNSLSSGIVPILWIRWAWRLYLSLDDDGDEHPELPVYQRGSNKILIERVLRYLTPSTQSWWRLVNPTFDIPRDSSNSTGDGANLQSPLSSVPIIVLTSRGDPLHDDGMDLGSALEMTWAKVDLVESDGSHVIGPLFDTQATKRLMKFWAQALYSR